MPDEKPDAQEWAPAFLGQRPPFAPGNQVAVRHGAFSPIRLEPRAAEIADDIRELVPHGSERDEIAVRLLSLSLAQVEAATLYAAEQGLLDPNGNPQAILRHLGTMMNTAARLCDRLGLTPAGRAREIVVPAPPSHKLA